MKCLEIESKLVREERLRGVVRSAENLS